MDTLSAMWAYLISSENQAEAKDHDAHHHGWAEGTYIALIVIAKVLEDGVTYLGENDSRDRFVDIFNCEPEEFLEKYY